MGTESNPWDRMQAYLKDIHEIENYIEKVKGTISKANNDIGRVSSDIGLLRSKNDGINEISGEIER